MTPEDAYTRASKYGVHFGLKTGPKGTSLPQSSSFIRRNNVFQNGGVSGSFAVVFSEIFQVFSKHCLRLLSGDLKMATFYTDMEEIHRIIFDAPDGSDDSWESSSESKTSDNSASEDAESEENDDEPAPPISAARGNRRRGVQFIVNVFEILSYCTFQKCIVMYALSTKLGCYEAMSSPMFQGKCFELLQNIVSILPLVFLSLLQGNDLIT